MKEIAAQGRIVRDGQCQFAFRACEASGPLQNVVAQCRQLFKMPHRISLFRCPPGLGLCPHLKLSGEIVVQNRSHQIKLIAAETPDGNIIHLPLGFHLPKSKPSKLVRFFMCTH
jgi:hypothetical protein